MSSEKPVVMSPVEVSVEFEHWNDSGPVVLDLTGKKIQVIGGLNGAGKTMTMKMIDLFTNIFSNPSTNSISAFEDFALNLGLKSISCTFQSTDRVELLDARGGLDLPYAGYNVEGTNNQQLSMLLDLPVAEEGVWMDNHVDIDYRFRQRFTFSTEGHAKHGIEPHERAKKWTTSRGLKFVIWSRSDPAKSQTFYPHEREYLCDTLKDFCPHFKDMPEDIVNEIYEYTGLRLSTDDFNWEDFAYWDDRNQIVYIIRASTLVKVDDAFDFDPQYYQRLSTVFEQIKEIEYIDPVEFGQNIGIFSDFNPTFRGNVSKTLFTELVNEYGTIIKNLEYYESQKWKNEVGLIILHFMNFLFKKGFDGGSEDEERKEDIKQVLVRFIDLSLIRQVISLSLMTDGADFLGKEYYKLTSGQRRIITILGSMYSQPSNQLILIDEPELSMHISWQRKFIDAISSIESLMQGHEDLSEWVILGEYLTIGSKVIVATHSPDIVYNHQEKVIYIPPNSGDSID